MDKAAIYGGIFVLLVALAVVIVVTDALSESSTCPTAERSNGSKITCTPSAAVGSGIDTYTCQTKELTTEPTEGTEGPTTTPLVPTIDDFDDISDPKQLTKLTDQVLDSAARLEEALASITDPEEKKKVANQVVTQTANAANKVFENIFNQADKAARHKALNSLLKAFENSGPVAASTLSAGETKSTKTTRLEMLLNNVKLDGKKEVSLSIRSAAVGFNTDSIAHLVKQGGGQNIGLSTVLFANEKGTDSKHAMTSLVEDNADKMGSSIKVNTEVIMVTLATDAKKPKLTQNINMTMKLRQSSGFSTPQCFALVPNSSDLDDEGCKSWLINSSHAVCSCNHLTSFAILMSVTKAAEKSSLAQDIVSYICVVISIISHIFSFVTFVSFSALKSDRNTIHANLAATLCLGQIIFLAGIDQTSNQTACSVIAGILHYMFLSSFCWMAVEGMQIYMKLVLVFETSWSMTPVYLSIGYICPAIIVGVSAGVKSDGYGTKTACWLKKEDGFQWSFIGPVLTIITWNVVMLCVAIHVMRRHFRSPTKRDMSALQRMSAQLKGAATLTFVLGLTWIFGVFNFGGTKSVAFAYIFVLLNGSQGLFMFLFHCLANDKVKKEYRRVLRKATWMPDCLRNCLFRLVFTPSSHDITTSTGPSVAKGTLTQMRDGTSTRTHAVSTVEKSEGPSRFRSSVVDVPTISPTKAADAGVYLGEEEGKPSEAGAGTQPAAAEDPSPKLPPQPQDSALMDPCNEPTDSVLNVLAHEDPAKKEASEKDPPAE